MKSNRMVCVKLICVGLCLAISLWILRLFSPFANTPLDHEYAVLTADDEIITKTYPTGYCTSLWFFHASPSNDDKLTGFIRTIPNVKIIDDDQFYVEITANQSIHDALSISNSLGVLDIDIQKNYYNRVHEDDIDYDFNYGLYVDCSQFDMVVHAPIRTLQTSTQTILDFDVAKGPDVFINFDNGGTQANIYNIDADNLTLYCSDTSDISISGSVTGSTTIKVFHNTRVDADNLMAVIDDVFVSNRPLGISYIKHGGEYIFESFGLGSVLSIILVVFPTLWFCLVIRYLRKLCPLKKQRDPQQTENAVHREA